MTSLDMVEQEGGGTYFLLSKYYQERDTIHGLNVTSLDKKGSVTWSRDYIFYEDSSAVETVGSIVMTEEGLMIDLKADYAQAFNDINVSTGVISHGSINECITLLENLRDSVFSDGEFSEVSSSSESLELGIDMFPNPSSGTFQLKMATEGNYSYRMLDVNGKEIQGNKFQTSISIKQDLPGLYVIQLFQDDLLLTSEKMQVL